MKWGITFNEGEEIMYQGLSFDYWDIPEGTHNFDKEYQNLQRKLNNPPIEFLERYRAERIGKEGITAYGNDTCIIAYNTKKDMYLNITSTLPNGNIKQELKRCQYRNFKTNSVKGCFEQSVYNTGYPGGYKYNRKTHLLFYDFYHDMMKRGHSEKFKLKNPHYGDVSVDPIWHNFQTFGKWCEDNYYYIPGCRMQLDKDILIKGNRIYGPDRCVFVPQHINSLFVKSEKTRGETPIGVYKAEYGYTSSLSITSNKKQSINLGSFKDPIKAFYVYKKAKEEEIKRVADIYKQWIPERLYIAMYNYQVEITD